MPSIAQTLAKLAGQDDSAFGKDDSVQKEAMSWIGKIGGAHFKVTEQAAKVR